MLAIWQCTKKCLHILYEVCGIKAIGRAKKHWMMYLTDKYLINLYLHMENAMVCVYITKEVNTKVQTNSEISDFLISLTCIAPGYLGLELQCNRFVCHYAV